jgi:hypothetical protein
VKTKKNIWILFEERPKKEIIQKILEIYIEEKQTKYKNSGIKILPIIKNKVFEFLYKIENFKIDGIEDIFLVLVSGHTSFVDFLLFENENKPKEEDQLKNCLYGIEETKTDSSESRNTAAGQRGTKFLILEYFSDLYGANLKKIMLYNNKNSQNQIEAGSVKFIKKCLKTTNIKFYGDYSGKYEKFTNIDEVIAEKNNMRKPPAGNTPIRLIKNEEQISISGILSKPKDEGNINHDPNQGQLIIISNTLRKLGWKKDILITDHNVKQSYIDNSRGNKFLYAMKILNIMLKDIKTPKIKIPNNYWLYENNGEKIATILLHTICNYLNFKSIYENHAGSERGYFYTNNDEEIVVNKKFNEKNINLPDYVFQDIKKKEIFVCEGEMSLNYNKGIKQIEGFDIFINQYIKKYYPDHKIIKTLILSNGEGIKLKDKVLFQLNSNGEIIFNNILPKQIINFL